MTALPTGYIPAPQPPGFQTTTWTGNPRFLMAWPETLAMPDIYQNSRWDRVYVSHMRAGWDAQVEFERALDWQQRLEYQQGIPARLVFESSNIPTIPMDDTGWWTLERMNDAKRLDYTLDEKVIGRLILDAWRYEDCFRLDLDGDETLILEHKQDCYERVWIEDVDGDIPDMIGEAILFAEVVSKPMTDDEFKATIPDDNDDGGSWTFYKFATIHGSLTIRFAGTSNGCYAEDAEFTFMNTSEADKIFNPAFDDRIDDPFPPPFVGGNEAEDHAYVAWHNERGNSL